jgi:hypothetical protein
VTANRYHEWLQNALVQAGAGALHDHFCVQGLWVTTGNGEQPFKLYGDDQMLVAGAGDGVEFAATTARLSQDSIRTVLAGGSRTDAEGRISTILNRFPSHVVPHFAPAADVYHGKEMGVDRFKPPDAAPLSLADWHNALHGYMKGTYLKSLFDQWAHHWVSQTPGQGDLVPFELVSPHAGKEF